MDHMEFPTTTQQNRFHIKFMSQHRFKYVYHCKCRCIRKGQKTKEDESKPKIEVICKHCDVAHVYYNDSFMLCTV